VKSAQPQSRQSTSRYRTIVADPPWHYGKFGVGRIPQGTEHDGRATPMPYGTMTVDEIKALPVESLAEEDAHLYLWTTQRYLRDAFAVVDAWGFKYSATLVWAKTPMPTMIGGAFRPSTEFILFARRGSLEPLKREVTQWWNWKRQRGHSVKPDAMLDIVEGVSPGPYVELFARRARFGWDYWGNESLGTAELPEVA
jgi:N6-adenosine-specific RNA methylase IME4